MANERVEAGELIIEMMQIVTNKAKEIMREGSAESVSELCELANGMNNLADALYKCRYS